MKRNISRVISILLAFCVAFSGLPLLAGSLDVNAASVTKKKIMLKAAVTGKTTVKLKWNKVKSPGKGYAVFRDGKVIKRLSTKKTSFADKGLKPGSKHRYQIKTYTKKKVTKWYNKKTGKWQKKKPAKKYCGKSKKVWTYIYKKKSNIVRVKTKSSVKESQPSDQDDSDADTDKTTDETGNDGSDKTSIDDTAKSSYTYNIHFLNEPYGNGGYTVIYLETDNPNRFDYSLGILNSSNQVKNLNISRGFYGGSSQNTYDDLDLSQMSGYICICSPECIGNCTLVIYEWDSTTYTDVVVKTKSVFLRDYSAEQTAWMQSVINEVTDSTMTNKQKMNAICDYYYDNFKYSRYNGQNDYITLITDVGIPYWIQKRTNSAESPAELVEFGTLLGYPLQNMYDVYERGTPEWRQYHMCAYSAEDNEYYEACPSTTTGYMDPNTIKVFDPDTYQFWGE